MINYKNNSHNERSVPEQNIVTKTIAAVLSAAAISAFSIGGAYLLVAEMQPATLQLQSTAENGVYCGEEKDGDDPKGAVNTCGEEKDGGGEGALDA